MKLRTRLILAMLACALLPLAAAGVVARAVLTRSFEHDEAARREATVARVGRALQTRSDSLAGALARFCAHDYLVDRARLQLAARQFDSAAREELSAVLPEVRTALGLDTLALVQDNGEILANAHFAGRAGVVRDSETFRIASRAPPDGTVRVVRTVRVRDASGPRDVLVLEAMCVARRGTAAIAVAGGQILDQRLVGDVREEGLSVRVVPGNAGLGHGAGSTRVLPLRGAEGDTAASVVVTTRDERLRAALADLNRLIVLAAVFAVVIALLLALVIAPRLARPISEVADAADKIALGARTIYINARAGGEAGRLVRAFNHMAQELDAADQRLRRAERIAAWRDIARQMAHEIKNPLTPIQMAVELLRKSRERGLPDFETLFDEETRIVLEEVARLRRLVENFSRFARAPRPNFETGVSVGDIVAHVVGLQAAAGTAEVTGESEPELPTVRADREQLTQVLINLVANAAYAADDRAQKAPDQGSATVRVSARKLADGRVAVSVEDNGSGIDSSVLDRLFEPYVTTKQGKGGTGLGLAIAYRIVHEHGGTITADTSPKGTRFEVVLPVAESAA